MGNSPPVRHGCQEAFNHETGICDKKENVKRCEENKEELEKKKPIQKDTKKPIGLFFEFMEFLIKQGVYNKNIFLYLLNNRNILEQL